MHRRTARLAILGAAMALTLSIGSASAAENAHVRVLHGSPDAPSVDVFVNGDKVAPLSGLEFGDLSQYVAVPGGSYAIKVCATADNTICPIDVPALDVAAGTKYTIAATNLLASIETQVIVDAPAPVADQTQVRVVHFSHDTPAVDVLTQDGSATVVDNLAYPNATDYLTLPAGSYDLKVCANADNSICPLDPGALDLAAGTSYSVFAIGSLDGESLTAAVGVDAIYAPATDTAVTPGSSAPFALLMAGIALFALAATSRFLAVRARS
jgi:hypothetical protein